MIRWDTDPEFLSDADLLAEFQARAGDTDQQRREALAAEIERRNLNL